MAPKKSETKNIDKTTNIEPGMVVEATQGDLGEEDVSKPKVTEVVQDQQGKVDKLIVQKGVIFRKTLEIPADRVQSIDQENIEDESTPGKVVVEVGEKEAESLTAVGAEALDSEQQHDLLDRMEKEIPTVEGLRELEASNKDPQAKSQQASAGDEGPHTLPAKKNNFLLRVLGPGFLSGMAGNDASAVATYAVDGATTGYGHLWLLLLSTPLYQSVQFACAKVGRITQKGLSDILREHYSRWVAIPASLILIVANIALIAADLVAIGSGFELITGLSWVWFVIPVAVILWYLTVYALPHEKSDFALFMKHPLRGSFFAFSITSQLYQFPLAPKNRKKIQCIQGRFLVRQPGSIRHFGGDVSRGTFAREAIMGGGLSLQARYELLQQMIPQYREASSSKKRALLDAFTATTGYNRKYTIWLLNHAEPDLC